MPYNFAHKLAQGNKSEQAFLEYWEGLFRKNPNKTGGDFLFTSEDYLFELKTDFVDYGNLFIEQFIVEGEKKDGKRKDGGPKKAMNDGCRFYAHLYHRTQMLYVFDPTEIYEWSNANFDKAVFSHQEEGCWVENVNLRTGEPYWAWGHAFKIGVIKPMCVAIFDMSDENVPYQQKSSFISQMRYNLINERRPLKRPM